MEINIRNYKSILSAHSVHLNDSVIFTVGGKNLVYTVRRDHLSHIKGVGFNRAIFNELDLEAEDTACKVYGKYVGGCFPSWCNEEERDAMIRYLFEKVAEKEHKTKEKQLPSDSWASAKTIADKPTEKPKKRFVKKDAAQPEETISLRIPTIKKFSITL